MNFIIEKAADNIYLAKFESQYDLAMSFVRIQEFYESPSTKFRGKYFSLESFIDYWAENFGYGVFDYPARWKGFNVPGKTIEKFWTVFEYEEREFREKEAELLMALDKKLHNDGVELQDVYLIGGSIDNGDASFEDVVAHEVAHALYGLNSQYRRKCNKLLREINTVLYSEYEDILMVMGYAKKMVKDELQAYLATNEGVKNNIPGDARFASLYKSFLKK